MYWNPPKNNHIIYEALSAIADNRLIFIDSNKAQCISTSHGKHYDIEYDLTNMAIMSNDNMAYYVNEVSYPMVAILLEKGKINYDRKILEYLKDIHWKDINQRFKNDYMKSVNFVLSSLAQNNVDIEYIKREVNNIWKQLINLKLTILGNKKLPPNVY